MERIAQLAKQYRYGILVLLVGIGLMLIPVEEAQESSAPPAVSASEGETLQSALESILEQIEGAGKVKVLLTQAAGETILYQQDTDQSGDTLRQDAVIVTDADRTESGLVRQVLPPEYLGAVVVCQGGDRAAVRLSIVEAVSNATGLTADKITVLKMK